MVGRPYILVIPLGYYIGASASPRTQSAGGTFFLRPPSLPGTGVFYAVDVK